MLHRNLLLEPLPMKALLAAALLSLTVASAHAEAAKTEAAEVPAEVKTYVTTHHSDPMPYASKILVGHGLDGEIIWMSTPNAAYRYTNLNGQMVVVEKKTNHVVAVY
jgi:hypothetical protein